ncbi:UDP-glucose 4-epimerase GalE [Helicobacter sp. MIT 99-5507]|uniref:UDP-glucose 4-epimerase GalE n=1 Tax=Helicobacter sp. MIT 99-5507 TaxID=152489 RepID=UPI000E1EF461|nr:UDP-glucose 4-epimerase GalE [Helicobacter sp. MIT 99-5507]RDU56584.1 UDP-glucose 4-epimerase GalE [Helicobacter sp. MIT 99-5507]
MKNILFTGAAGYIGSCSAYHFLKNTSCNIFIIDNLSSGFVENISFLESNFKDRICFINLDLNNTCALKKILQQNKFDCVVHFAASLIVPESVVNPLLYYSNNTKNTLNLISLCIESKINKFIFSSTAAVYGEPKVLPVKEDSMLVPINPYGTSKMMSEMILRDTSIAYKDFNFVALRYFNVAGALSDSDFKNKFGLGQRSKNATHLIKVACECAVGKRESISIFGDDYDTKDGSCIRDYIHIDDLALAHLSAYEFLDSHKKSEVFNVGYGSGYSVKEVIDIVKEVSGVDFRVVQGKRREGDPAKLISDNAKILKETSWKPKYNDLRLIAKSAYLWECALKDENA